MTQSVIPGTYIEVRSEGLISAGGVATGIIGIVGTARMGPVGSPVTVSSLGNARDVFGAADPWRQPEEAGRPLTLMRSLELAYANGASTVLAVRVAGDNRSSADLTLRDGAGNPVVRLTARTPGTWGNDIRVTVEPAEDESRVEDETHTDTFDRLDYGPVTPAADNQFRVYRGTTRRTAVFEAVYKVVREEDVAPDTNNRYYLSDLSDLSDTPVEQVPAINHIVVRGADGSVVREYGDGSILYGAGVVPDPGEVCLNPVDGELTFEAGQKPAAGQRVHAQYAVGHLDPLPGQILVTTWDRTLDYAAGEAPKAVDGDRLEAAYRVARAASSLVTVFYPNAQQAWTVPAGTVLAALVNASPTSPITATADHDHGTGRPEPGVDAHFGVGGGNQAGGNGGDADADEYAAGLDLLADELVNIVVLAGQDSKTAGSRLAGHLNATERTDHERLGVMGAAGRTVAEFLGHSLATERIVLVAPGLRLDDGGTLPAAYTAAAVAGLISSVPVQTSLTNRVLAVGGLALRANRGEQEQLIRRNVLTVVDKEGLRVLKGVTTAGMGTPFSSVPTLRIVDYAKYGVRSAANPYLGRLNNARVRAALKATLDAFLTRMVQDEALTRYALEVTATRAQEIAGEVSVVMTVDPMFSIDRVQVVMTLH